MAWMQIHTILFFAFISVNETSSCIFARRKSFLNGNNIPLYSQKYECP
jgi:hypothetical protein